MANARISIVARAAVKPTAGRLGLRQTPRGGRRADLLVAAFLSCLVGFAGQASAQTTISIGGGAAGATQTLPPGQLEFGIRVPLKGNSENVLTVVAGDELGRKAKVDNIKVAQIALSEIVRARVTAQRLTTQEVKALVADGTIKLADPANFNVSRFVIALTVGGQQVEVPMSVIRPIDVEVGTGEAVSIGCSSGGGGVQTTERSIAIPCGGGGGGGAAPIIVIPFEVVAEGLPGKPSIPGVILIEGRIKTLKEFYKVTLLLENLSNLFTIEDITARLEIPEGALTQMAPASGTVSIDNLAPGDQGSGQFIIRGDTIGTHTITAFFGAMLTGPFLPEPVPISGSASTDVEVRGPPKLAVKVSHPDFVEANVPYDLVVEIWNTDTVLDALYASLALDIGADARLIDPETGEILVGPVERTLGDILKGQSSRQTYRVLPLVTGPITSCTAAASQNIQLTVAFIGRNQPGCAIGTLPAERSSPDGRPTVTVLPAHNTVDVASVAPIVAIFSAPMLTATITSGYPEATFKLIAPDGSVVPGTLRFAALFGNTAAIFEPAGGMALSSEYTILVEPSIFSEDGLALATGMTAKFLTKGAAPPPDNAAPDVALAVEPPLSPNAIPLGQIVPVIASSSDNIGVVRIDLFLDDVLIDAKKPNSPVKFLVDTANLDPLEPHVLRALASDAAGNEMATTLVLHIATDLTRPVVTLDAPVNVLAGRVAPIKITVVDDGRVDSVDVFLDGAAAPVFHGLLPPYDFALQTAGFAPGPHALHVVATDGAGNQGTANGTVTVVIDAQPPVIVLRSPSPSFRVGAGRSVAISAEVLDNVGVASVLFFVDAEALARSSSPSGFLLDATGLGVGNHALRIRAADTAGNPQLLEVAFEVFDASGDTTPPPAPDASKLLISVPVAGVTTITGLPGAVEARANVVLTNVDALSDGSAAAGADGSFAAQIEAAANQIVNVVAVDESGNVSPPTPLAVPAPATLTSISVDPSSVTLDRNLTSQQLTVTGTFSDASHQVLASGLSFVSSVPATVSATIGGLLLPGQNGAAVVTVSSSVPGVASVQVPVTVNFTTVTGLVPTPNPVVIEGLGRGQRIAVSARFSDNSTGPFGGVVKFATGDPAVAIVDATGLVTSTGIGSTTVTVASTGLPSVPVLVAVNAVQPTSLIVTPNSVALTALGQTQALSLRYTFSDGTEGPAPFPTTFSSRASGVASVSAAGVVSAEGEGNTFIDVQAAGFSAVVSVSVSVPTSLPPPVINSLGRPIAGEGDTLAILGRNFSGTAPLNFVTINGLQAEVQSASFDRLIAVVPDGATSGPVVVRVAGEDSNSVNVGVYARKASAVLAAAAFSAPGTLLVDLGSATVVVQPGDNLVVSGDPNLIVGAQWNGLTGPAVVGTLVVTIDGQETVVSNSPLPVDLTALLGPVAQPRRVSVSMRIEGAGGQLSSQGVAILSGPPNTGPFSGQRFSTGDTIDQQTVVRFRVNAPDGSKFAATAGTWYNLNGSFGNGSVGGSIVGGAATPNDGTFRTFVVQNGEVAVTYSDAGVFADFGAPRTAVIALVPADASGNRVGLIPVAEARVLIGALDSASILPQQPSAVADGADHPITVDVNSVRDNYGNRITQGTRFAVTAGNWYRRSDGGFGNGSAGGPVSGGVPTPNDGQFRTVTLAGGAAQLTYSPAGLALSSGQTGTAVLAAVTANAAASRISLRPFAEGSVAISSLSVEGATIVAVPAVLSATSSDNRSVITLSGLTDGSGRPIPDGGRVAVTAGNWYRLSDGGFGNGSFGGSIVGGDPVPNDGSFRSFQVIGGSVTFTYSNTGLVLNREATAETVISVLPAQSNGSRIGTRPFADVRITQAGLTTATIVATPSSTLADGTRRPVAVAVTNIRDALGNIVPDGTRIALTAGNWYRRSDGGFNNGSVGGTFLDGVQANNDGQFFVFTVSGGRVDATFSAETIAPLSVTDNRSSVISAVAASEANNRLLTTPFAEGVIAVSSVATGTAVANPVSLLADKQDRQSVITITGLTDAQGRQVPDGTKVAVTAQNWYRLSDGGFGNGSSGGTMVGGDPTPNDGSFRTYTVANGAVTVTYSNAGLFVDTGGTAEAVISILPATGAGNRIGTRPLATASVLLAGMDMGTFIAPATTSPGSSVAVTLTNMRDAAGNLLPDGAKVAVTAGNWYNRNGSFNNGSAGGTIVGGVATPNDGSFKTFTVTGGSVTFSFAAPNTLNVTSVLSVLSADGAGNRNALKPFATFSIRAQ